MSGLRAITTVYSYYLPEIRTLVSELTRDYPHDVFLRSVSPGLDDFHRPIIDRLVSWYRDEIRGLDRFPCRYPTAGSEEGIREVISHLAFSGVRSIYMWQGDYEGYREVARSRGVACVEVGFDEHPARLQAGYWFLSNPSARDGQIVERARIDAILEAGHRVFYDLSYVGSTAPALFEVDHPGVFAAAISFSKPFGLFYYRIGFTFLRESVPALEANRWFKNVFGLLLADRLLASYSPRALADRYKHVQSDIVGTIRAECGLPLLASDAFLLAHLGGARARALSEAERELIARFRRGEGYRFCLTPYFLEAERQQT